MSFESNPNWQMFSTDGVIANDTRVTLMASNCVSHVRFASDLVQWISDICVFGAWNDKVTTLLLYKLFGTRTNCRNIIVMPYERHGVSNQIQLWCLFCSLFRLTTKNVSKLCITGLLWGHPRRFSSQNTSNAKGVSSLRCHLEVIQWIYGNRT